MSQFARSRIRCEVFPGKSDPFVMVNTNQSPEICKGAGVDFEFAFFDVMGELLDVSNIANVTLLVYPSGTPSTTEILKTTTSIQNISQEAWDAGTGAHVTITLLATETAIAAGNHEITLYGHTTDDTLDADCFGFSKLLVVDRGITAVTNPTLTPSYGTLEQIQSMLNGYVPYVMPPGKKLTFTSDDSTKKRIMGVANDGTKIDSDEV